MSLQSWTPEAEKMLLLSLLNFESSPDWSTFAKSGLQNMEGRSLAACKIHFGKLKREALRQKGVQVEVKKRGPRTDKLDGESGEKKSPKKVKTGDRKMAKSAEGEENVDMGLDETA